MEYRHGTGSQSTEFCGTIWGLNALLDMTTGNSSMVGRRNNRLSVTEDWFVWCTMKGESVSHRSKLNWILSWSVAYTLCKLFIEKEERRQADLAIFKG
jgi:hypothetical protein